MNEQVPAVRSKTFVKAEAIKFGWETAKKNWKFFIPLLLLVLAIEIILNWLGKQIAGNNQVISIVFSLVSWIVSAVLALGQIKIALKFVDNQPAKIDDLFSLYKLAFKFFLANLLYSIIVGTGFVLLIIPGIILSIKFSYYAYFIADRGLGPLEALKKSWELTAGIKWNLFLFSLLLGLINLAGVLALMIGLFWTVPLTMVAQAFVFRKLAGKVASTPAQ